MIVARAGSGWQYALADLSLILFLVASSAAATPAGAGRAPERSEPVAIYRTGPGAPPLRQWLDAQPADPRQQLTILARYGPADLSATMTLAEALAHEAQITGRRARIVVEPGRGGISASLAYDPGEAAMARSLRGDTAQRSR